MATSLSQERGQLTSLCLSFESYAPIRPYSYNSQISLTPITTLHHIIWFSICFSISHTEFQFAKCSAIVMQRTLPPEYRRAEPFEWRARRESSRARLRTCACTRALLHRAPGQLPRALPSPVRLLAQRLAPSWEQWPRLCRTKTHWGSLPAAQCLRCASSRN